MKKLGIFFCSLLGENFLYCAVRWKETYYFWPELYADEEQGSIFAIIFLDNCIRRGKELCPSRTEFFNC